MKTYRVWTKAIHASSLSSFFLHQGVEHRSTLCVRLCGEDFGWVRGICGNVLFGPLLVDAKDPDEPAAFTCGGGRGPSREECGKRMG